MVTPAPLPPMLQAILLAARIKFPGREWSAVENHLRKAWNAVAHEEPWEAVRGEVKRAWEAAGD